jgi:hypothetical protein
MDYGGITEGKGLLLLKEDYDKDIIDFGKLSYGFVEQFDNVNENNSAIPISERTTIFHMFGLEMSEFKNHIYLETVIESGQDEDEEDLEQ